MNATIFRFIIYIFIIALADQISKYLIIFKYQIDTTSLNSQYLHTVNDYLNFYIIWNKGFAFGLFQNDIVTINTIYILIMIAIAVGIFIYALMINKRAYYFSFGLLIGGAIGNLIDRIQYSAVLDFIDVHYGNYHWYVFNIADISISCGCIAVICLEIFTKNKTKNEINS